MGKKKIWSKKNLGQKEKFGSKKILGPKNWGPKKILIKNFGRKKIDDKTLLIQKKIGSKKFRIKQVLVKKKWVQNNLDKNKI